MTEAVQASGVPRNDVQVPRQPRLLASNAHGERHATSSNTSAFAPIRCWGLRSLGTGTGTEFNGFEPTLLLL